MFWKKKNKDENRYYLLPGMGRSNRRQRMIYLRWSVVVGFLVSVIFAVLLYFMSNP